MTRDELKEKALEWFTDNDKDSAYLLSYIPRKTEDADSYNKLISGTFARYWYNHEGYDKIVDEVYEMTYGEQTRIQMLVSAFKKLIMLSIFFDSFVINNFRQAHLEGRDLIELRRHIIAPKRINTQDERGTVFILSCCGEAKTVMGGKWYSIGFIFEKPAELFDTAISFSDIHFVVRSWTNLDDIPQSDLYVFTGKTIKTLNAKELLLER